MRVRATMFACAGGGGMNEPHQMCNDIPNVWLILRLDVHRAGFLRYESLVTNSLNSFRPCLSFTSQYGLTACCVIL